MYDMILHICVTRRFNVHMYDTILHICVTRQIYVYPYDTILHICVTKTNLRVYVRHDLAYLCDKRICIFIRHDLAYMCDKMIKTILHIHRDKTILHIRMTRPFLLLIHLLNYVQGVKFKVL